MTTQFGKVSFAALLVTFAAGAAVAADLPSRDAPRAPMLDAPMLAQPYNWSGFYFENYAGATFGQTKVTDVINPQRVTTTTRGFTGGALAGYGYQSDWAVVGVEAELGYEGARGSSDFQDFTTRIRVQSTASSFIGRDRLRIGYASGAMLFYLAGGLSFANDKITIADQLTQVTGYIPHTQFGYNLGVGFEYMLTPNWVGRVEYVYDHFSSANYNFLSLASAFDDRRASMRFNTVRVALGYKF